MIVTMHQELQAHLIADRFLTQALGMSVFRLADSASFSVSDDDMSLTTAFVWAKIASNDSKRVHELLSSGFRLICTEVQLERPLAGVSGAAPSRLVKGRVAIRQARPEDGSTVGEIAAVAFAEDRFHCDPAIGAFAAARIKEAWAKNFFLGLRGDRMLVAEATGGVVVGFVQLLDINDSTVIDLIAVVPSEQGRGIGRALIEAVVASVPPNAKVVRVGTQLTNTPSLRLYSRAGFGIVASTHVLHRHPTTRTEAA